MDKVNFKGNPSLRATVENILELLVKEEIDISSAAAVITTYVNSNYVRTRRMELEPMPIPIALIGTKKEAASLAHQRLHTKNFNVV